MTATVRAILRVQRYWARLRNIRGKVMAFQATKLSALIVVSILSTTAALANEQGWVFTQRSAQLGDQYVYLSQSGLRLINPNSGIGITAHTPAWDVDYFNEKTRLYFREPLGDWKKGR